MGYQTYTGIKIAKVGIELLINHYLADTYSVKRRFKILCFSKLLSSHTATLVHRPVLPPMTQRFLSFETQKTRTHKITLTELSAF